LGELAPLTIADVTADEVTGISTIKVTEDLEQGRRLKNAGSRRVVPIHPELVRIGFLRFVEEVRQGGGSKARIFPLLTPGPKGGLGEAWSKWFGRYIRGLGITNRASVFHSFRHSFKDALRRAGVSEDVNDALTDTRGAVLAEPMAPRKWLGGSAYRSSRKPWPRSPIRRWTFLISTKLAKLTDRKNGHRLRQQRGLTQEQLAFEAEIDPISMGGIERGRRNPSLLVMARIADALSVPRPRPQSY